MRPIWIRPTAICLTRIMIENETCGIIDELEEGVPAMKKWKSIIFVSILALALFGIPLAALGDHVPLTSGSNVDYELDLRVFLRHNRWMPMAEFKGLWEYDPNQFSYRALTLGTYYRVSKNVKVGGFYRLQMGARHDNDWINLNPGWGWQDTSNRPENLLILDVTPRFLMPFMPGRDWVFAFKTRYLFNTYNTQQTLTLRPGITYFLMQNREPLVNFTLNYELYLALNYSDRLLYEQWPYLEVMYHLSPTVKLSGRAGYRVTTWSTSKDVVEVGDTPYEVKYRAFVIGAGMNLYFGR
jgi:hypothetical protein